MGEIDYELIRTRRKTISITVDENANVVVRAPLRAAKGTIAGFVILKRDWILEKQQVMRRRAALHRPAEPASGEEFLYLGRKLMLAATDRAQRVEAVGGTLAFPRARMAEAGALLRDWYVAQARAVLPARARLWMARTGIAAESFGITNARRRWGSCSTRGSVNFTWRLVMAPPDVIDYVVVHELAHIEHPDHSRAFWARVGEIMPDYKEKVKWLRENSALLRLY